MTTEILGEKDLRMVLRNKIQNLDSRILKIEKLIDEKSEIELLGEVIRRLQVKQNSKYKRAQNAKALDSLEVALLYLRNRDEAIRPL